MVLVLRNYKIGNSSYSSKLPTFHFSVSLLLLFSDTTSFFRLVPLAFTSEYIMSVSVLDYLCYIEVGDKFFYKCLRLLLLDTRLT